MALQEKTNIVEEGLDNLIEQFKGLPQIEALITSYLNQLQKIEEDNFDLLTDILDLDVAEGAQLDVIGTIVGEPRSGRNDTDYLVAIRIRILINASGGEIETLNELVDTFFGGTISFELRELFPAAFEVAIIDPINDANAAGIPRLARLLSEARGGGIGAHVHYAPTGPFTFDIGPGFDQGAYGGVEEA